MADKPTPPDAGAPRRKRAVPTIDLTATEVPSAADAAAPEAQSEPPPPEELPAAEAEAPPPEQDNRKTWVVANIGAPVIAAGVVGAALMSLVLVGLWLTGLVPVRYASGPASAALDTKSVDALGERLSKIEAAVAKLPAGDTSVADRVAAADSAMKSLGVALAALNRRSDDVAGDAAQARQRAEAAEKAVAELRSSVQIATTASAGLSSADMDALQKRIAGLEQFAKLARDDIAKTAATDGAVRLALSAAALRIAVMSGGPFAGELAQTKSLGGDGKTLAALEPYAASGVPSQAKLVEELRALLPALLKTAGAPAATGGFVERLQANAGNLVRIRPLDAPPGDDAPSVLARVEVDAAHADIAAALADLGKLPETARAPAQGWIAKAQARQAALAAARQVAADTSRALGPPAGGEAKPQ